MAKSKLAESGQARSHTVAEDEIEHPEGVAYAKSPHDRIDDRRETGSALARAVVMIETLLDTDGTLGIQEICSRLELPRQSAHRILNQLLDLSLIQRHVASEQYTIGPRLRGISLRIAHQTHRHAPWHTVLEDLAHATKETCNLAVLDQNKVLLIDRIESEYALRVNSEIGRRLDPHSSSLGKLLLAHLPKGRRQMILKQAHPLQRYTSYTVTDIDELESEFAVIRRQGWAYSNQGTTLGMFSLAAPVRDSKGRVLAGVGVQAPFVRATYERAVGEFVPILLECAGRMTDVLIEEDGQITRSAD